MTEDKSKGFVFKDIKNSKVADNTSSGFETGFEVSGADNLEFVGNTAVRRDEVAKNLTDVGERLQAISIDFSDKQTLQDVIQEAIQNLSEAAPRKSILKEIAGRIDVILMGALGQILATDYQQIFETLKSIVDSLPLIGM